MSQFREENHTQWGVIIAFILVLVVAGGVTFYGVRTSGRATGDDQEFFAGNGEIQTEAQPVEELSAPLGIASAMESAGSMGVAAVSRIPGNNKPANGHSTAEIGIPQHCATGQVLTASDGEVVCVADAVGAAASIPAGSITGAKIARDTITADKIAANAITTSKLANGAVTSDKLVLPTCLPNQFLTSRNGNFACEALPLTGTPLPTCKPIAGQMILASPSMTVTGRCNLGSGGCERSALQIRCTCVQSVSGQSTYNVFVGEVCRSSGCETKTGFISGCPSGAACAISCPAGSSPSGSSTSLGCADSRGSAIPPTGITICYP